MSSNSQDLSPIKTNLETDPEDRPQSRNSLDVENGSETNNMHIDQKLSSTSESPNSLNEHVPPTPNLETNDTSARASKVLDPRPTDLVKDPSEGVFRASSPEKYSGETNNKAWAAFNRIEGAGTRKRLNTARVWITVLSVLAASMLGFTGNSSNRMQYLNYRIGRDNYNYTREVVRVDNSNNTSAETTYVMNAVQAETSQFLIYLSLTTGIPSAVACLIVGSYSDYLGRRPLIIIGVFGCFMRCFTLAVVSFFDLPLAYLFLGGFIEGLTGTLQTLTLATTALVADITPVLTSRASRFAILQATLFMSGATAQVSVGYMIDTWSYYVPAWVGTGLGIFAFLVALLAVPETQSFNRKQNVNWSPFFHFKNTLGFYFAKSHGQRRALYIIGIFILLLVDFIQNGRLSVETLFFLNDPISWDSVEIGIFEAIRLLVWSVTAVVLLRIVRVRYPLEGVGMLAALSLCAGLVIQALAQSGFWLYISAAASILCAASFPIPKALLSRITSPGEQGALFSSLAFVSAVADMTGSTFSTFVYKQTLSSFKGAIFMLLAGFAFLIGVLEGVFWIVRKYLPAVVLGEANFRAQFRGIPPPDFQGGQAPNFHGRPPPQPKPGSIPQSSNVKDGQQIDERTPLLA